MPKSKSPPSTDFVNRTKKFLLLAGRNWWPILIIIGLISFVINVLMFYPGFMSNDSLNQLRVAKGVLPAVDLVPPVMSTVWRFLIFISGGRVSSMLVFQLGLLWTSLTALSIYLFKVTKSRKLSLLAIAIGWLPFVVNISGVIWKDNQMTFSLLLALVLSLYIGLCRQKFLKIGLFSLAILLVLYAALVRYNALIAVLPIVFLLVKESGFIKKLKWQLMAVVAFCVLLLGTNWTVNTLLQVQSTNPTVAIMLDDILNVEHEKTSVQKLQTHIDTMQACHDRKKTLVNNFWACATDEDRHSIQYENPEEMRRLWLQTVLTHPLSYISYRAEVFTAFLFPSQEKNYYWHSGIVKNELGQSVEFERFSRMLHLYVKNGAYKNFPFFFQPWFWLAVNIALLLYSIRALHGRSKKYVLVLSSSSVIYILGFLPTGATNDYRYVYWPVIAALLSLLLILTWKNIPQRSRKPSKT